MVVACRASFSGRAAALLVSLLIACPIQVAAFANVTGHVIARDSPATLKHVTEVVANAAQPGMTAANTRAQFVALQQGQPIGSKSPGHHFLTRQQIGKIDSIHCLQDKQRNPNRPCAEKTDDSSTTFEGAMRIGHYPHWTDRVCHGEQEFFCDPTELLTPPDQHTATEHLRLFKERTLVNCGQLESVMDPDAERRWYEKKHPIMTGRLGLEDYRPFNLAVMLADEWPSSEMDPKSMQYFGRVVMTEWGLMPIFNGVDNGNPVNQYHETWDEYHSNCPNTAVLFILPRYHQAYLLSPSDEFIGAGRGGPEVIAATLAGLERGGVHEAVMAGIDMVEKVLKVSIPGSLEQAPVQRRYKGSATADMMKSDATFIWALRFAYAFVVLLAVVFLGSFIYFILLPEGKERRSRTLMGDGGNRLALRAENISA